MVKTCNIIKNILEKDKASKGYKHLGDKFYDPEDKRWEDLDERRKAWKTKNPGKRGKLKG